MSGHSRFDAPENCADRWENPLHGAPLRQPPPMAAIAKRVLYLMLRLGLMQHALDRLTAEKGRAPARVMTPGEFAREFGRRATQDQ